MAGSVADRVRALIEDTVSSQGVNLWDVRFIKEGASWYLRVFIDSENGINIDDCANVSRAIDPVLDEADPIDKSYYLEVCSPGLNRELSREEHFSVMQGKEVKVFLYSDRDSKREFSGVLEGYSSGDVTIKTDEESITFKKGEYSRVLLDDDK